MNMKKLSIILVIFAAILSGCNRWEDPEYGAPEAGIPRGWYQRLFNDAWVKPGLRDRPAIAEQVEGACYW